MTCPNGYLCFHREGMLLIILIIIGVLSFGYAKYQENDKQTSRDMFPFQREQMMDYPYDRSPQIIERLPQIIERPPQIIERPPQIIERPPQIIERPPQIIERPAQIIERPIQIVEQPISYNESPGVAINVPTRGFVPNYEQVGILYGSGPNPQILPLYGKPTYPHSNKWLYYTQSDDYHTVRLTVQHKKRKCSGDYGCEELYDGDEVDVPPYRCKFKVNLYERNTLRYLPYI